MGKMKEVIYKKKGLPHKMIYCDADKPVPNDNEVLIKVHARGKVVIIVESK